MNLSFSTQINSKPTYFPEKIVKGLIENKINVSSGSSDYYLFKADIFCNCKPKLHTIRKDRKNRWIRGRLIHFVINNRTKKRYQFVYNPIPVISTQEIWIHGTSKTIDIWRKDSEDASDSFRDGYWQPLTESQILLLAQNDGFDNIADFWQWFDHEFAGKIIHWTNLKY